MIVIAIMAIVMGLGLATMQQSGPRYERETFIARLNSLLFLGWQNAIKVGKPSRVSFDFEKKRISLAQETDSIDKQTGDYGFKPLVRQYGKTELAIPENIKFEQFIIEGYDELRRYSGRKNAETWFFIMPGGLTQEVAITMVDLKDRKRRFSLVLNPFSAQFASHEL